MVRLGAAASLAVALHVGCDPPPTPTPPSTPVKCPEPVATQAAPAHPAIAVKNEILVGTTMVGFSVAIPTDEKITFNGKTTSEHHRVYWYMNCSLTTNECSGVTMDLSGMERGEPLKFVNSPTPVTGAKVLSRTPSVFTVGWGPWTTFTIDKALKRVTYVQSGTTSEGRGFVDCQ